jgi:hypothetical protein
MIEVIKCYLLLWSARQQMLALLGVLSSLFKTSVELRLETLPCGTNSACCVGRRRSG